MTIFNFLRTRKVYGQKRRIVSYYTKKKLQAILRIALLIVVFSPTLIYFFFNLVFFVVVEKEKTMLPNIETGSWIYFSVFSNKEKEEFQLGGESLKRGDIVATVRPDKIDDSFWSDFVDYLSFATTFGFYKKDHELMIVRRVVGMPGEYLHIKNKQVYINDNLYVPFWQQLKSDPRVFPRSVSVRDNLDGIYIPKGYIFLLGDNWDLVADSRVFSLVPVSSIVGVVRR